MGTDKCTGKDNLDASLQYLHDLQSKHGKCIVPLGEANSTERHFHDLVHDTLICHKKNCQNTAEFKGMLLRHWRNNLDITREASCELLQTLTDLGFWRLYGCRIEPVVSQSVKDAIHNLTQQKKLNSHSYQFIRRWHRCQQVYSSLDDAMQLFHDMYIFDADLMRELNNSNFFQKHKLQTSQSSASCKIVTNFVAQHLSEQI